MLIAALRRDGRASYHELGKIAGLSRPATRARVNRLLDSGTARIVGVVHPSVFGLNAYAHVSIHVDGPARDVAQTIASYDNVPFVSLVSGRFSLIAELRCRDNAEVDERLAQIRALNGVRAIDTVLYRRIVRDTNFPPGEYSPLALDEVDRALLIALQNDGRAPFAELSEIVSLSPGAARTRVLRLLEASVLHVGARTYSNAMPADGQAGFALALRDNDDHAVKILMEIPGVQYLATTVGRCDVIGTATSYDAVPVIDVLDAVRAVSGVTMLESWTHLQYVKENYDLPASLATDVAATGRTRR
jgi:DNA-binding Lrp family transcriptional regulator